MGFKNLCVLVLKAKVASALEGLSISVILFMTGDLFDYSVVFGLMILENMNIGHLGKLPVT